VDGTHKRCTGCKQVRVLTYFTKINSRYGGQYEAICTVCKGPGYKPKLRRVSKDKSRRYCNQCNVNKPMEDFYDASLISNYGKICTTCKGPNYKSHKARKDKTTRRCSECSEIKSMQEFYDAGLKSKYGLKCKTCKGPGYSERRRRNNSFFSQRYRR
jgi:hypothetical protein